MTTAASLALVSLGLGCVARALASRFGRTISVCGVALLALATFLSWCVVVEPQPRASAAFALAALLLCLVEQRLLALSRRTALLAAVVVLAAIWLHPRNAGLALLVPGLPRKARWLLLALAAGSALLVWPAVLDALFSARAGLLFWNPALWLGVVGLVVLARKDPEAASQHLASVTFVALGVALTSGAAVVGLSATAVFAAALPSLALGLAASLAALLQTARRRPAWILGGGAALLVLWNGLLMEQYRIGAIPADDTIAFPRVTQQAAQLVANRLGAPLAWPGNWLLAARQGLSVATYDVLAGLPPLDTRTESRLALGRHGPDAAMLVAGWSNPEDCAGEPCRTMIGNGRIVVPLLQKERRHLALRGEGWGQLAVGINGSVVLVQWVPGRLGDLCVDTTAAPWRAGLNELTLRVSSGGWTRLVSVDFPTDADRCPGLR